MNPTLPAQATSKFENIPQFSETYYPAAAIKALMGVLAIPTLKDHHQVVLHASRFILRSLTLDCVPYLPFIIPPILSLIENADQLMMGPLFEFLMELVKGVGEAFGEFCPKIFNIINKFIEQKKEVSHVLELIECMSHYTHSAFKCELSRILPKLLAILYEANLRPSTQISKTLSILKEFGDLLDDYLHLVILALMNLICAKEMDPIHMEFKAGVLNVIRSIVKCSHFKDYLPSIVHPLVKQIEPSTYSEYGIKVLSVLTHMLNVLNVDFAIYLPLIQRAVLKHRIMNYEFCNASKKFLRMNIVDIFFDEGNEANSGSGGAPGLETGKAAEATVTTPEKKPPSTPQALPPAGTAPAASTPSSATKAIRSREQKIDFTQLMREFDASKCYIKEDWVEWQKKTSIELLKQNPSPVIFACNSLAQVYDPIAGELYNMAFSSCWKILNDKQKEYIISNLYRAIESPTTPISIYQTILNLDEFMEHEENSLPMLTSTLGSLAEKCNALAKALYYREIEFESNPSNVLEALISINYGLQQPEAANGILIYAQNKNLKLEMKKEWYQKLHRWEDALRAYQVKLASSPKSEEAIIGQMQCYKSLSDWDSLARATEEIWVQQRLHEKGASAFPVPELPAPSSGPQSSPIITFSPSPQVPSQSIDSPSPSSPSHNPPESDAQIDFHSLKPKIAEMASAAAWNLGKWEKLEEYSKAMEPGIYESLFYESVLCIHKGLYEEAKEYIEKAREVLDTKIKSLINESYSRAYTTIVDLQHLKELEETITYRLSDGNERKKHDLEMLWKVRLQHAQKDIDIWQKTLTIRSLVKTKAEDVDIYIKYANLCRRNARYTQCMRVLEGLRKEIGEKYPERLNDIAKVEFALMKCMYDHGNSKEIFEQLKKKLAADEGKIDNKLKAKCYLKLGLWEKKEQDTLLEKKIDSIIHSFYSATQLNPNYYKAWNAYGLLNYDVLCMYEELNKKKAAQNSTRIQQHCLSAINGFVHAIALGGNDITKTLQNLLRFLKLWFNYGDQPEQEKMIRESFKKIDVTSWLPIIPQILARIDIKSEIISKTMLDLLETIGRVEPQALIYPLSMMERSTSPVRKACAATLMERIKQHSPTLISQALQVCGELIRSAILLHERWYEIIEEATKIYYSGENTHGAIKLLMDLHEQMAKPPETMNEIGFYQAYGSKLACAEAWMRKYLQTKSELDLNQAWEIYYNIYRSNSEKTMISLELRNVSPILLKMQNLSIVVPGLFKPNQKKLVTIIGFAPNLEILQTKQHPRKLAMHGSDGKDYLFLLKGHEDNRQDERAMQLFGLINTLLSTDPLTQKKDLSIRRYAVFPLSPNAGLIGWVQNCDTLHALIKEYRTNYKIIPTIEFKLMRSMCETFEFCCLVNKVEIFRHAMDNTYGQDLYKILWLKSNNSEIWLERRTNYTRSHAVMCMVGYILGLGDRHPSNLMLDRYSGKIVHIDFGDCFESAMRREKFPEKVPFRLTRMLIKAMEVSGIEGNYKTTCEQTMKVLRGNKDSLLAILEAFVYDPLISFRLLTPNIDRMSKSQQKIDPRPDRENVLGKSQGDERRKLDDRQKDFIRMYGPEGDAAPVDKLNQAAQFVISRIENKLNGKEFNPNVPLDEITQIEKLIKQATSDENLAQCYIGWCPYW